MVDDPKKVMMAIPEPDAVREAQFFILRQIDEKLTKNEARMDRVVKDLHDVKERVVRIEGGNIPAQLDALRNDHKLLWDRVNVLEADRNARVGAGKFLEWIWRFGPWMLMVILAVWSVLRGEK